MYHAKSFIFIEFLQVNTLILQVRPNALDIFESVQSQVRLPATYSVKDMQQDMVKYMKRNKEELEVNEINHFNAKLETIKGQWF